MNKLAVAIVLAAAPAFAQPAPAEQPAPLPMVASPFGSSPYVVAYAPPVVTPSTARAHHGFTLEAAVGGGRTSREQNAGAVTLAIGGWLTTSTALAFRVSDVGSIEFVGGSLQVVALKNLWVGAGGGQMTDEHMSRAGVTERTFGTGGFGRVGYQLAGDRHVLYISAELQVGQIDGETREAGLVALGYQLL